MILNVHTYWSRKPFERKRTPHVLMITEGPKGWPNRVFYKWDGEKESINTRDEFLMASSVI